MPHPIQQHGDSPGHESFLDIVANMVGILIILVMVVGVRVRNAPVAAISAGQPRLADELQQVQAQEQSLRGEAHATAEEVRNLQEEAVVQRRTRDGLALLVSAAEHEIEARRRQMDARAQERFDLTRAISEARFELERLDRQATRTQQPEPEPIVVESYPTPLSRTVTGHEAHFQLRGRRIAPIPLEALIERFEKSAAGQQHKLLSRSELTDTVGPLGGFELRYTLERHDLTPEMAMAIGRGGSEIRLRGFTLIPVSSQLGEPVEEALADGSEFRGMAAGLRPGRDTITIWVYEDSFAAFRRIKKELYGLGFSVAARPLPMETPIGGGPRGSRSAAQ